MTHKCTVQRAWRGGELTGKVVELRSAWRLVAVACVILKFCPLQQRMAFKCVDVCVSCIKNCMWKTFADNVIYVVMVFWFNCLYVYICLSSMWCLMVMGKSQISLALKSQTFQERRFKLFSQISNPHFSLSLKSSEGKDQIISCTAL